MRNAWWDDPLRGALAAAAFYFVLACGWILGSTRFAASLSAGIDQFEHAELVKGALFALVTSAFFGVVLYALLVRIAHAHDATARAQHAVVSAERRAVAGVLASAFAHDCNNAVTLLRAQLSELEHAREDGEGEEWRALFAEASASVERVTHLLRRFARVGRRGALEPLRPSDLVAITREALDLAVPYARLHGRRVELLTEASRIGLEADAGLLHQAVTNLLLNAIDAARRVRVRVGASPGRVWVAVHDDGPGIALKDREDVFLSFFTTKTHGSGLGLASVRFAAEAHGGTASVLDSELGGACVRLELPVSPPEDAPVRRVEDDDEDAAPARGTA